MIPVKCPGLAVFRRNQFVPPDFLSGKQAIALQGRNVGEEIAAEDGIEVACFGKALLLPIVCFPMQEAGTEQVGNRLGRGSLLSGDQIEAEVEHTQIFGHLNGVFESDGLAVAGLYGSHGLSVEKFVLFECGRLFLGGATDIASEIGLGRVARCRHDKCGGNIVLESICGK